MHDPPVDQDIAALKAVELAEFDRIHADLPRQLVDALLYPGMDFGMPEAAHRPADRVVGVDAVAINFYVRHLIRAGTAVTACPATLTPYSVYAPPSQ